MKRSTILLAALLLTVGAMACGPYNRAYSAAEYNLFRKVDVMAQARQTDIDDNCREWRRMFSACTVEDVRQVVYYWPAAALKRLRDTGKPDKEAAKNTFARQLTGRKGREVLDYLLLCKEYEQIRGKQTSPWYYHYDNDVYNVRLRDFLSQAAAYKGRNLADRYLLLQLRAAHGSRDYAKCVSLWQERGHRLRRGSVRRMAESLAAGAFLHTGDSATARSMFLALDDLDSYSRCVPQNDNMLRGDDMLPVIYADSPDHPYLLSRVSEIVADIEVAMQSHWEGNAAAVHKKYRGIYNLARKAAKEGRAKDKAAWNYIAAFLSDVYGDDKAALRFVSKASRSRSTREMADNIRVLDFYLRAKNQPRYGSRFERYALREMQWLDRMMATHLSAEAREEISKWGVDNHDEGLSQYYWSDMMRKVAIGYIAPLCIKSGKPVKALQYLNMADNRIFQLVRCRDSRLANGGNRHNDDYFINLDSLPLASIKQYARLLANPRSEFDRFTAARSYTDPQYLDDIIGTRLLRQANYGEAARFLGRVSDKFNNAQSVRYYNDFDPFTLKYQKRRGPHYKLHFAQRMDKLERDIAKAKDPNTRAELMLQYARGQHSSISQCWTLTSYYNGEFYCYPFYSALYQQDIGQIEAAASKTRKRAFALFTDRERKARAYYENFMYKTVATQYADTEIGAFVRGHCDKLADYTPGYPVNKSSHYAYWGDE